MTSAPDASGRSQAVGEFFTADTDTAEPDRTTTLQGTASLSGTGSSNEAPSTPVMVNAVSHSEPGRP